MRAKRAQKGSILRGAWRTSSPVVRHISIRMAQHQRGSNATALIRRTSVHFGGIRLTSMGSTTIGIPHTLSLDPDPTQPASTPKTSLTATTTVPSRSSASSGTMTANTRPTSGVIRNHFVIRVLVSRYIEKMCSCVKKRFEN